MNITWSWENHFSFSQYLNAVVRNPIYFINLEILLNRYFQSHSNKVFMKGNEGAVRNHYDEGLIHVSHDATRNDDNAMMMRRRRKKRRGRTMIVMNMMMKKIVTFKP